MYKKKVKLNLNDDDKERKEIELGELLREWVCQGLTDKDVRDDEGNFLAQIGDVADGLTREEILAVWENVWDCTVNDLLMSPLGTKLDMMIDAGWTDEKALEYEDLFLKEIGEPAGPWYLDGELVGYSNVDNIWDTWKILWDYHKKYNV